MFYFEGAERGIGWCTVSGSRKGPGKSWWSVITATPLPWRMMSSTVTLNPLTPPWIPHQMQMMKEVMIVVCLLINLKNSINFSKYRFSLLLHFFWLQTQLKTQLYVCSSPDMGEAMSADSLHVL